MSLIVDTLNHLTQFAQGAGGTQPLITPPDISPLPKTTADAGRITIILNIIFTVLGAISVLMIVIGGIKYAGSQGDPQSVSKATGTITYPLVGLVVAILAVAIVDFVTSRAV